jgi:hypothetical protein
MVQDLLTEAAQTGDVREDIPPAELTRYCGKNLLVLNTSWHHYVLRTSVDNSQRTTEVDGPAKQGAGDDGRGGGQRWGVRP